MKTQITSEMSLATELAAALKSAYSGSHPSISTTKVTLERSGQPTTMLVGMVGSDELLLGIEWETRNRIYITATSSLYLTDEYVI